MGTTILVNPFSSTFSFSSFSIKVLLEVFSFCLFTTNISSIFRPSYHCLGSIQAARWESWQNSWRKWTLRCGSASRTRNSSLSSTPSAGSHCCCLKSFTCQVSTISLIVNPFPECTFLFFIFFFDFVEEKSSGSYLPSVHQFYVQGTSENWRAYFIKTFRLSCKFIWSSLVLATTWLCSEFKLNSDKSHPNRFITNLIPNHKTFF